MRKLEQLLDKNLIELHPENMKQIKGGGGDPPPWRDK